MDPRLKESLQFKGDYSVSLDRLNAANAARDKLIEYWNRYLKFEGDFSAGLERFRATVDTTVSKMSGGAAGKGEGNDSQGIFWFTKEGDKDKPKTEYGAAYIAKKNQYDSLVVLAEEHSSKKIALKEKEYTALKGFDEFHAAYTTSKVNIRNKAYSAMEKQMLSLVETKKFSVKAFGTAVAQQVKLELVGLAAKAAVWSLFEVAMGFKDLATPGMQGFAALHFKSAAQFAAVSGMALAGAAVVQSVAFGGAKNESAASTGSTAANSLKSVVPVKSLSSEPQKQTQQVTIVINNPLSEQNWDQIAEDNIIPAINSATDRNIELKVVSV
jgi:hypothetical protein